MTLKEEWARKQFESVTANSINDRRMFKELEERKRQLKQEKEALQNEVQIAKTEVHMYSSYLCM